MYVYDMVILTNCMMSLPKFHTTTVLYMVYVLVILLLEHLICCLFDHCYLCVTGRDFFYIIYTDSIKCLRLNFSWNISQYVEFNMSKWMDAVSSRYTVTQWLNSYQVFGVRLVLQNEHYIEMNILRGIAVLTSFRYFMQIV